METNEEISFKNQCDDVYFLFWTVNYMHYKAHDCVLILKWWADEKMTKKPEVHFVLLDTPHKHTKCIWTYLTIWRINGLISKKKLPLWEDGYLVAAMVSQVRVCGSEPHWLWASQSRNMSEKASVTFWKRKIDAFTGWTTVFNCVSWRADVL